MFYPQPAKAVLQTIPMIIGAATNPNVRNYVQNAFKGDGNAANTDDNAACSSSILTGDFKVLITCPLSLVLEFNAMLLGVSAGIFGVAVDVDRLSAVLNNEVLYTAWGQIRDVLNIGFILFLLYSAFSIIFQIGGKYGEKKIILTIVLMALLVNFSFPITRVIIDASNSLMYTLLTQLMPDTAADPTIFFTNITRGSAMKIILEAKNASISQLLAAVIFSFLLAMTFLALALMFLIRMVALAALIIFSPVAFVGNIAGKDFGWWDYLFKYALFGPIMVLALSLSVALMEAVGSSVQLAQSNDPLSAMANMSIPIVVLWMAMGIAQKMGIEGGSMVQGLSKWTGGLMKKSSIAGLKAIDRNTLARWKVSPRQFMKAWKETTDRAEKDKLAVGSGAWNDRLNKIFGGEETHYEQFAIEGQIAEKQKEQSLIYHSSEELIELIEKNKGRKGLVAQYQTIAAQRTLAKSNDTNDLMHFKQKDLNAFGTVENEKDGIAQDGTAFEMLQDLKATGLSDQEAYRQMYQLGEIGLSSGNAGLYGAIKINKDGTFARNTRREHAEAALGKLKNIEPQELMKKLHPDAIYKRKWNAETKKMELEGLTELGEMFFSQMVNPAVIEQLKRSRTDFRAPSNDPVITAKLKELKKKFPEQAENIDSFITTSENLAKPKPKT